MWSVPPLDGALPPAGDLGVPQTGDQEVAPDDSATLAALDGLDEPTQDSGGAIPRPTASPSGHPAGSTAVDRAAASSGSSLAGTGSAADSASGAFGLLVVGVGVLALTEARRRRA